ncbi:hypothetical protein PBF_03860 [Cytobacillus firmus DS1]|uniref:Uncharacterized protein n=1 Tax=Cytobacillus firmus DS1 TaxID=1307436 RepID=W7LBT8_CYTFI|nr:hypothetical protein PBF_03860 [Cytobacillus firmus DS1]
MFVQLKITREYLGWTGYDVKNQVDVHLMFIFVPAGNFAFNRYFLNPSSLLIPKCHKPFVYEKVITLIADIRRTVEITDKDGGFVFWCMCKKRFSLKFKGFFFIFPPAKVIRIKVNWNVFVN